MGTGRSRHSGNTNGDTVKLARQQREKHGEVEVSYGGEADLHQHFNRCTKNPGHLNFIPVDTFSVEHLPASCYANDLVDLVRAASDLTVRLSVKYVSEGRPETFPQNGQPFPCYNDRGRDMMRVGTGWVCEVTKHTDSRFGKNTCPCRDCLKSSTPRTEFASIKINTVAHVIFDKQEAEHSTCHLFFDRGGTPGTCKGVVTLNNVSVMWGDAFLDSCEIVYVTHDMDLADKLEKMVLHWYTLGCRLFDSAVPFVLNHGVGNLAIIVSHPHGCSKMVSIGQHNSIGSDMVVTYTAATCPGSSGARVLMVMGGAFIYWMNNFAHNGCCKKPKNLNYSNRFITLP